MIPTLKAQRVLPLEDRIVVEPCDRELYESVGEIKIKLPDVVEDLEPIEGYVREIGPGRELEPGVYSECHLKKGDRILYGRFTGHPFDLESGKRLIMRWGEVLGIVQ